MSSTFHPQWANHVEQSTLSPFAKHQLMMGSVRGHQGWYEYRSTSSSTWALATVLGGRNSAQDMRDSNIITLYKNKGDCSDCNNYPEMSLLSINGKAFTRLVLNKLQTLAERLYPEALCGFRAGRWTIDMIFSLRQLQEKCGEQRKHLHIALIDLTKAFDLISRVCSLSCREWDATQAPKDDHVFPWRHARNRPVRRLGYVLAPTLFGIFFSLLLSYALSQSEDGVYLHTRSDGNLFNLARLRAKTKVRKVLLRDTLRVPYSDSSAPSHTLVACLVSP